MLFLSFMLAAVGLISCQNEKTTKEKDAMPNPVQREEQAKEKARNCDEVHWTYKDDATGPAHWKDLCDGFSDCGGTAQSPVDILTGEVQSGEKLSAPVFHYENSALHIVNNGHTVQFNIDGEQSLDVNGKTYKLLQFHLHAPSEHTVNGKHYPLEVHFVHGNEDGSLAVIGVLFKEGQSNAFFEQVMTSLPQEKGMKFNSDLTYDPGVLIPGNTSYYHYKGSLTTPPCSEIVDWYVMKNPLEASAEQLEKWAALLHHNNRPVQPLNGRIIQTFEQ